MPRVLRWTLLGVLGLAGLVLAVVVSMALLGVTLDLGFLRGAVEKSASRALDREVHINGPVVLEFSGWPSIEIRDVTVANVPGGRAEFLLQAGLARLDVRLLSLLERELQIGEIAAESVALNLEHDAAGNANWAFRPKQPAGEAEPEVSADASPDATEETRFSFVGLEQLSLQQVSVSYYDAAIDRQIDFGLDALDGEAPPGEPMTATFSGYVQRGRYDLALQGDAVEALLDPDSSWQFTLSGEALRRPVDARGELGLRNEVPILDLELAVQDLDVGAILAYLELVEGMEASARTAAVELALRGRSLHELLRQSRLSFDITEGRWVIEDPNTQAGFSIEQLAGNILVEGGAAVNMKLEGEIEQAPVRLNIVGAKLEEYFLTKEELPLTIDVAMLDTRFRFDTRLAFPISKRKLNFALSLEGERLDAFNELLELDLPPLGPYLLDTRLTISAQGYDLSRLRARVGESKLDGRVQLHTARDRPGLEASLQSPLLRVDDFYFGEREQPAGTQPEETPAKEPRDGTLREVISNEILNKFDAAIHIEAQQVTSGGDELGSGLADISVEDGRLAVAPLKINTPGGGINLNYTLQPRADDVVMTVDTDIERFDYGVMARLVDPDSTMQGTFSVDVEFTSTAPDLARILAHADGHLDFALYPGNMSAESFDLWAVNLLTAVASEIDKGDASVVNCAVVRLGLEDGVMQEHVIFMDTTRMSVDGRLTVDFKKRHIDLVAAPRAKRPEFFSLATPVKVQGSFDDFGLGVNPARLTGSVISFVTSPLHVPLRRVFRKEVPADGREACAQAWARSADAPIEARRETLRPGTSDKPNKTRRKTLQPGALDDTLMDY